LPRSVGFDLQAQVSGKNWNSMEIFLDRRSRREKAGWCHFELRLDAILPYSPAVLSHRGKPGGIGL